MNKQRRAAISKIVEAIEELHEQAAALRDEEQEYFDNMPESIQNGVKGTSAQEALENLDTACDALCDSADVLASVE